MSQNKIVRLFLETNMACSHNGLRILASKNKVDLQRLGSNEHVLFINKAQNRVKLYSSNGVISYLWREKGRLDMAALSEIPNTFTSQEGFNIKAALKRTLVKRLGYNEARDEDASHK